MSIRSVNDCDECRADLSAGDEVYCRKCWLDLQRENEKLQDELEKLQLENGNLQERIDALEAD